MNRRHFIRSGAIAASLALPAFGLELALADLYRDLPDATPEPAATAN